MPTKPKGTQRQKKAQQPLQIINFESVMGMDTSEARDALQPGLWSWLMNFQPIGRRTLRALNGAATPIYTASGKSIIWSYQYVLGSTGFSALFFNDGSAIQVNLNTGATTTIASAGTFWTGSGSYPHAAAWGNSGILIVSNQGANSYWAWDGTTLYSPSGSAPTWLYPSGNTHNTMPTGIAGTAIEIYQQTVWIVNGRNLLASAPSVGTDFATSDGGVSFTATDSYVQNGYFGLKQLDGYLYLFAASGVDVISDVTTSGSPPTTTFLRTNVDPKTGTTWRDTIKQTPTSILYSNATGTYEVAGGATKRVSGPMDGLLLGESGYTAVTFPTNPTAFLAQLNDLICYGLTATITDPDTQATVAGVMAWDGARWFLASQQYSMTVVGDQDAASVLSCWASDGSHFFQAFQTPSTSVTKKAKTWLTAGQSGIVMRKEIQRLYAQFSSAQIGSPLPTMTLDTDTGSVSVPSITTTGTLNFVNNSGGALTFRNSSNQVLTFVVLTTSVPLINAGAVNAICLLIGITFSTTAGTLDVVGMACGYVDYSQFR